MLIAHFRSLLPRIIEALEEREELREAATAVRDNNRKSVTGAQAREAWADLNAALSRSSSGEG